MDYTNLVANLGFPIAVTFFVLFRLEKALKENTHALNSLCEKIKR